MQYKHSLFHYYIIIRFYISYILFIYITFIIRVIIHNLVCSIPFLALPYYYFPSMKHKKSYCLKIKITLLVFYIHLYEVYAY